jgi:hypothetical protein
MKRTVFFVLALTLSGMSLQAQTVSAPRCSVHAVSFQGWDAQEVVNPWVKLTFVPKLGGRLMQVEFNGHPYLFVNPKYRGQYISPQQAAGDWINYGGDKIWPMPEGNNDENHWILASTALDDLPYEFKVVSQGERCVVELTGEPDTITGLQYSRTISVAADSPQISFHAVMKNATAHPIEWSVQSVSQYDLSDPQNRTDYNHHLWAYTPVNPATTYPGGFHVRDGLADDPSFSVSDGLFRLHWMHFQNEVWIDSTSGWLAVIDEKSQYGMVEKFAFEANANYPDKATVIFYKNGPSVHFDKEGVASIRPTTPESTPYYMEAEVNSPIVKLLPNATYAMDTTWNPVKIDKAPQTMTNAGIVTQKLGVAHHADQVTLTGSFSVFTGGDLTALLMNRQGVEVSRRVLKTVRPEEMVVLNETVPVTPDIAQVVLKLIDTRGADYGILDKVRIESSGSISQ